MNEADRTTLEELLAAYVDARLLGRDVSLSEICSRRPDLAEELRSRVETFDRLGELTASRAAELSRGDVVGGFRIEETIGRGGMGTVHRATELSLGRTVALKRSREPGALDPRLVREARAIARLRHPNVVALLGLVTLDERPALVMEHVDGESLADRIARGAPARVEEVLVAVARLGDALHAAHRRGIVHRDVKPGNVLIARDGTPYLADFGLAHVAGDDPLTLSGSSLGTPAYMSPEQIDGRTVGPATDVWSLGVTAYEWLTGHRPFAAEQRSTLYAHILREAPVPAGRRRAGLPGDVDVVLARCLAKDPADRYPDARALAEDLRAVARGEPIPGRRRRAVEVVARRLRRHRAAAVAAAAILALALAFAHAWVAGRTARVDGLVAEAELFLERARFDDALDRLAAALARSDDATGRLRFLRAEATLRRIAAEHAPMEPEVMASILEDYGAALERGPETAAARCARGFLLAYLGRPGEAKEEIVRGRALPVVSAADAYHRARVEAFLGAEEAALDFTRDAVRLDPRALVPTLQLALHSVNVSGDTAEGRSVLDQCERVHPGHPAIEAMRARLDLAEGRPDAARARLLPLLERRPVSRRAVEAFATVLHREGDLDGLEALYDTLLRDAPDDPRWSFPHASVPLMRGDTPTARRRIEALAASRPGHPMVLGLEAILLLQEGDAAGARARIDRIATLPASPAVLQMVDFQARLLPEGDASPARAAFAARLERLLEEGRVDLAP